MIIVTHEEPPCVTGLKRARALVAKRASSIAKGGDRARAFRVTLATCLRFQHFSVLKFQKTIS